MGRGTTRSGSGSTVLDLQSLPEEIRGLAQTIMEAESCVSLLSVSYVAQPAAPAASRLAGRRVQPPQLGGELESCVSLLSISSIATP